MTHQHHDYTTGLGAIFGLVGAAVMSQSFWLGLVETSIYAVVGSGLGAIVTFFITRLLKRFFKTDKQ